MKNVDYILIGQGLAGTVLAHKLISKGKNVVVIDENKEMTSSKVAAGLYNPVTGRRAVLTWMAETLFDHLRSFYSEMEQKLNTKLLYDIPMYRPFRQIEDQNEWCSKLENASIKRFVKSVFTDSIYSSHVNDPHGGLLLRETGYLDIPEFIDSSKKYFTELGVLHHQFFNEESIHPGSETVQYEGWKAKAIVYCNGVSIQQSKYFSWLPMRPVKGDILYIKPNIAFEKIYNRGCFILPHHNGYYKAGSTYYQGDLHAETSEKGKNEIMSKIDSLLNMGYVVVDQVAGVRPATKDRKPILGRHPEYATLFVLNGLGTKGVTLAPYFAGHLSENLLYNYKLMPEIDIQRFYSLY
ncbi:MAG TPA: hypothetical protein DDY13_17860 [Cytophagales bacterium]|nr:hypothetical protein [Cytophagales bacterium]